MIVRTCCYALLLCAAATGSARADSVATPAAKAADVPCVYPRQPGKFHDGNSATEEEIRADNGLVKQYMADMDVYMACLSDKEPKLDPLTPMTEAEKKDVLRAKEAAVKKHNAAVADEEAVAARFNVELRAYKAKHSPSTPPKT
jgi:hypothetical protein